MAQSAQSVVDEGKKEFKSNHALEILNKLNEERKSTKSYCDITIKSENEEFPAHRCVLAAVSTFYNKMFKSDMKEKYEGIASVERVSTETMKIIMDFIYTCEITITMDNVFDIWKAADYMQLMSLKDQCLSFFSNEINPKNCLSIRACAKTYDLANVLEITQNFVADSFDLVVKEDEFKELDIGDVSALFQLEERKASSEEVAYNALIGWVNHDADNREAFFPELFNFVKLEKLPRNFLKEVLLAEKLVMDSVECTSALLKATLSKVPLDPPGFPASILPAPVKNISPQIYPPFNKNQLLIIGGSSSRVIRYDVVEKKWLDLPPTARTNLVNREGATAVNLDQKVYLMGGDESIERLSLEDLTSGWQKVNSMITSRRFPGSAVLDGYIYVTGGIGRYDSVYESGIYDCQCNTWYNVKQMIQHRHHHGLVSLQGLLYAIGGECVVKNYLNISTTYHKSVEYYNPVEGTWREIGSMRVARSGLAAVVLNNEIYAIGGYSDGKRNALSSVERYDIKSDSWYDVAPLLEARYGACACVVNGKIYVVGGKNKNGEVLSIEVYDVELNVWKLEKRQGSGRVWSAIACA